MRTLHDHHAPIHLALLPRGLLMLLLLGVLLVALHPYPQTLTGQAADASVFRPRELRCENPIVEPEQTLLVAFNSQFCIRYRSTDYIFVAEGVNSNIRLLLYHEPYRLFQIARDATEDIDLDGDRRQDLTITLLSLSPRGGMLRILFPDLVVAPEPVLPTPIEPTPIVAPVVAVSPPIPEQPAPQSPYLFAGVLALALIVVIVLLALLKHHTREPADPPKPPN